jgi:hypothetical protein
MDWKKMGLSVFGQVMFGFGISIIAQPHAPMLKFVAGWLLFIWGFEISTRQIIKTVLNEELLSRLVTILKEDIK